MLTFVGLECLGFRGEHAYQSFELAVGYNTHANCPHPLETVD